MRSLFVCLLLGLLAWVGSQGTTPSQGALVYLGLLIVAPTVASRLPLLNRRFGHIGALVAGLFLGWSGLISPAGFASLRPYADAAAVWVGVSLGASVPVALLWNRRNLLAVAGCVAFPALLCFAGLVLFIGQTPAHSLTLALVSALPAPLFIHLADPARKQALWLCLLLTGAGLLTWLVFVGPWGIVHPFGSGTAVALLVWLVGVEGLCRIASVVRSEPGLFLLHGAAALALSAAASASGLPALFLGLATGLYVSVRSPRGSRQSILTMTPASRLLTPFILADFAGRLPVAFLAVPLSAYAPLLAVYAIALTAGRAAGVFLGARLTSVPLRDWLHILPQGLPAGILLLGSVPSAACPAVEPGILAVAILGLCGAGLSLASWPLQLLGTRLGFIRKHSPS